MKNHLIAGALVCAFSTGVAQAADFSGPFVGLQINHARATTIHDDLGDGTGNIWYYGFTGFGSEKSRTVGGLRGGYNWTSGSLLYGVLAEYNFGRINTAKETVPSDPSYYAGAQVDGFGSLRGRLGVTSGDLAVFATGGLAYGDIENQMGDTDGSTETIRGKAKRQGYVFGFGAEYALSKQLTLGVDYSAYRFRGRTHEVMDAGVGQGYFFNFKTKVDTVGINLNYKF